MARVTFNEFKKRLAVSGWNDDAKTVIHYETHSTHSHFEVDGRMIPLGLCILNRTNNVVYFATADGALLATDDYFHLPADEEHEYKLFTCVEIR